MLNCDIITHVFQGGLAGLLSGLIVSLWVCVGAQFYKPLAENIRPLALQTHGCNVTTDENYVLNWTSYSTQASYVTSAEQHKAMDRCEAFYITISCNYVLILLFGIFDFMN